MRTLILAIALLFAGQSLHAHSQVCLTSKNLKKQMAAKYGVLLAKNQTPTTTRELNALGQMIEDVRDFMVEMDCDSHLRNYSTRCQANKRKIRECVSRMGKGGPMEPCLELMDKTKDPNCLPERI